MTTPIQQELAQKIYTNPRFRHDFSRLINHFFLATFGFGDAVALAEDYSWIKRLAESAVIMASSPEVAHQKLSYDIATLFIESRLKNLANLDGLMKIVCARLGNIPALGLLENSVDNLPQSLEIEAQVAISQHTVAISDHQLQLTDFQLESFDQLSEGFSLSLSAPTSAGKSFIVTQFIAQKFITRQSFTAVVIVPTRALIRQMTIDLQNVLRSFSLNIEQINSVELITSSVEPSNLTDYSRKLFVLTQERLQAILYNWKSKPHFDLVIVDESQKISDTKRGIILEDTISELTNIQNNIQYVFLSPLTLNPDFLLGLLSSSSKKNAIHTIISPVTQHIYEVTQAPRKRKLLDIRKLETNLGEFAITVPLDETLPNTKVERFAYIAQVLGKNHSNILYASGPVEAESVALALASFKPVVTISQETQETIDFLSSTIHEEYHLVTCLQKGVAYHYGSMPDIAKISVEELFRNNLINNVACTSTLLEGVNLPAKNVFIHNPKLGNMPMDDGSFWNLAGRAGRLLKDFSGNVFCINPKGWEKPVSERERQYHIESSLTKTICNDQFLQYCQSPSAQFDTESCQQAVNSLALKIMEKGLGKTVEFLDARVPKERRDIVLSLLEPIIQKTNIPVDVLKKNKSIDIRLQQKFYDYISSLDLEKLKKLSPLRPSSSNGYDSLQKIFELCDRNFMIVDRMNRYRYYALIASKWIREESLREMIRDSLDYNRRNGKVKDVNKVIRELVDTLNREIRFYYVRNVKCYCDLLLYEFERRDIYEASYPSYTDFALPNYLELGMSQLGTIQLHNLGLSRTTAIEVNRFCREINVSPDMVVEWVRTRAKDISQQMARPIKMELEKVFSIS